MELITFGFVSNVTLSYFHLVPLFKTLASLLQYYRDEPSDQIINFETLESKTKTTGNNPYNDNKIFFRELLNCN